MQRAGTLEAPMALADEDAASMTEQEFRLLYEATSRPVLAYLTGLTGHRDVAEDLLQEAYCRFLERAPARLDAVEARRYLFRIAGNLVRDRWRRGHDARKTDVNCVEMLDAGVQPDRDLGIDMRRAMQSLKPRERELLWLAYVEGMSHAEIAETTGLAAMSVRLLLFRARRRAAALLRPEEEMR